MASVMKYLDRVLEVKSFLPVMNNSTIIFSTISEVLYVPLCATSNV